MVHVNKFLGCVKLETGGIILAWLHIILYIVALISVATAFFVGSSTNQDDGEKVLLRADQIVAKQSYAPSTLLLALFTLFAVVICIAIVVISYRSIKAIKTRSHVRMFEMMALMFSITCLQLYIFAILLWLWPINCLAAVLSAAIYYYLFIVIYSLYRTFRKEYEHEIVLQQKATA